MGILELFRSYLAPEDGALVLLARAIMSTWAPGFCLHKQMAAVQCFPQLQNIAVLCQISEGCSNERSYSSAYPICRT